MSETANYWRTWISKARMPDHRFREAIQRSALAIKGLTYMPTGATVAALTTSLPETPGGERNWDYRFTWIRDSTFTLQALHYLDLDWEANEFMQFVGDLEPNEDGGAADHVRDRRPAGPDRVDPGRPLRLRGSVARCGSATAPSTSARTTSSAPLSTRSCSTPPQPAPAAAAVAGRPGAGRVRDEGLEEAGPGDLGGARQAAALRLLQADVLGRDGPGLEARGDPRRLRSPGRVGRHRGGDPQGHPRERRPRRRPAPALRHRRPRRLHPAGGHLRLPAGRRRGAAQERAGDRGRPHRGRLRAPLRHRPDRRRALGQGGQLPDLLLLARLGSGDHRRAPARARPDGPAAPHRLAARPLRRGVRPQHRPAPGELPPGLLPPRADRGRRHGSSSASASRSSESTYERLRRDRDRQRGWGRDARPQARRLRQEDPSAGARGLPDSRAAELAGRGRLRRRPLPVGGHLVRRRRTRSSPRRCTTSSAARPRCSARRSTACAPRTSARSTTRMASRRPGPSPTTRWSPTTRRRRSSTRCTVLEARTPRSPRQALPIPSRPSPTSRASSSSRTISPPPATGPSTLPAG